MFEGSILNGVFIIKSSCISLLINSSLLTSRGSQVLPQELLRRNPVSPTYLKPEIHCISGFLYFWANYILHTFWRIFCGQMVGKPFQIYPIVQKIRLKYPFFSLWANGGQNFNWILSRWENVMTSIHTPIYTIPKTLL